MMRKIILGIFLLLFLQTFSQKTVFAQGQPGVQCWNNLGGFCSPLSGCVGFTDLGPSDCMFGWRCCLRPGAATPTPTPVPRGAGSTTCDVPGSRRGSNDGVSTALGCVPTNTTEFVGWVLSKVIGLAGGIAFLLIIYAGFLVITSHGDPEKLNNGKEIIVSTLAGLLMIVFSVILLHIIGVNILQIPGL